MNMALGIALVFCGMMVGIIIIDFTITAINPVVILEGEVTGIYIESSALAKDKVFIELDGKRILASFSERALLLEQGDYIKAKCYSRLMGEYCEIIEKGGE